MKNRVFAFLCLLALAGCSSALPDSMYVPANEDFYSDFADSYSLKHKISIGEVSNSKSKHDVITSDAYKRALKRIYDKAGLTGGGYRLDADIVDYRWIGTAFFHAQAGVTVNYTLYTSRGDEVTSFPIVTTYEAPINFTQNSTWQMLNTLAIAFGENAAQAARTLASMDKEDLGLSTQPKKPTHSSKKKGTKP